MLPSGRGTVIFTGASTSRDGCPMAEELWLALAIADATDTPISSPSPFGPSGLASSSKSPTKTMSSSGMSALVGMRYPE
jgi:hypothetical protein